MHLCCPLWPWSHWGNIWQATLFKFLSLSHVCACVWNFQKYFCIWSLPYIFGCVKTIYINSAWIHLPQTRKKLSLRGYVAGQHIIHGPLWILKQGLHNIIHSLSLNYKKEWNFLFNLCTSFMRLWNQMNGVVLVWEVDVHNHLRLFECYSL